jgi:hypothetical protein
LGNSKEKSPSLRQRYVVVVFLDGERQGEPLEPLAYSEKQAVGFVKQLMKQGDLAASYDKLIYLASPKDEIPSDS